MTDITREQLAELRALEQAVVDTRAQSRVRHETETAYYQAQHAYVQALRERDKALIAAAPALLAMAERAMAFAAALTPLLEPESEWFDDEGVVYCFGCGARNQTYGYPPHEPGCWIVQVREMLGARQAMALGFDETPNGVIVSDGVLTCDRCDYTL